MPFDRSSLQVLAKGPKWGSYPILPVVLDSLDPKIDRRVQLIEVAGKKGSGNVGRKSNSIRHVPPRILRRGYRCLRLVAEFLPPDLDNVPEGMSRASLVRSLEGHFDQTVKRYLVKLTVRASQHVGPVQLRRNLGAGSSKRQDRNPPRKPDGPVDDPHGVSLFQGYGTNPASEIGNAKETTRAATAGSLSIFIEAWRSAPDPAVRGSRACRGDSGDALGRTFPLTRFPPTQYERDMMTQHSQLFSSLRNTSRALSLLFISALCTHASALEWSDLLDAWKEADPNGYGQNQKLVEDFKEDEGKKEKKFIYKAFEDQFKEVFGESVKPSEVYEFMKVADLFADGQFEEGSKEGGKQLMAKLLPKLNTYVTVVEQASKMIGATEQAWVNELYNTDAYLNAVHIISTQINKRDAPYVPSYLIKFDHNAPENAELLRLYRSMQDREAAMFKDWSEKDQAHVEAVEMLTTANWAAKLRSALKRDPTERQIFNHFLYRFTTNQRKQLGETLKDEYLVDLAESEAKLAIKRVSMNMAWALETVTKGSPESSMSAKKVNVAQLEREVLGNIKSAADKAKRLQFSILDSNYPGKARHNANIKERNTISDQMRAMGRQQQQDKTSLSPEAYSQKYAQDGPIFAQARKLHARYEELGRLNKAFDPVIMPIQKRAFRAGKYKESLEKVKTLQQAYEALPGFISNEFVNDIGMKATFEADYEKLRAAFR